MTDNLDRDQQRPDTQVRSVPVEPLGEDQPAAATRDSRVPLHPSADDHHSAVTQWTCVASSPSHECGALIPTPPMTVSPRTREFAELRLLAESFEDVQKARIAVQLRLGKNKDTGPTGEALASLKHAEKKLGLAMRLSFRKAAPEVYAWVKETTGVGEHLVARLLGCIGHPVIAWPYHWEGEGADRKPIADPPYVRSVSQLWSYCGHGDPARRRRKGMTAEEAFGLGNPRAKMLVHLIAERFVPCTGKAKSDATSPADTDLSRDQSQIDTQKACVSADLLENGDGSTVYASPNTGAIRRRSPYRDVYDVARFTYASREDWTPAHQHNAALRLTGKTFLRDLWIAGQPQ